MLMLRLAGMWEVGVKHFGINLGKTTDNKKNLQEKLEMYYCASVIACIHRHRNKSIISKICVDV